MAMARRAASLLLLVLVVGAWFVLLRPAWIGGSATWIVVRGSSMLPTFASGDLVIVRSEASYRVGDVVAYRVPDGEIGAGHVVIHRLVGGDADAFVAQGDNNDAPDPWRPAAARIAGRAWVSIPGVGRLVSWMRQPGFLGAAAAALVVGWLVTRRTPSGSPHRVRRSTAPAPR